MMRWYVFLINTAASFLACTVGTADPKISFGWACGAGAALGLHWLLERGA
jgi:hypothetical protein